MLPSNATVRVQFLFLRLVVGEPVDDKYLGLGVQPKKHFGVESAPLLWYHSPSKVFVTTGLPMKNQDRSVDY